MANKVFISFKMHDESGNLTKDHAIAKELYEALTREGVATFFSDVTLLAAARADYKRKIDEELDYASVMVVVSTSPQHVNSNWVRYEWDSFYNDILSERKKGMLISLIDNANINDFPRTLRQTQSYDYSDGGLDKVVTFIRNYLGIKQSQTKVNKSKKGSAYGYDIGNEKERLKVQAREESKTDEANISDIFQKIDASDYWVLDFGCSVGETSQRVFSKFGDKVKLLGVDKFESCVTEFNETRAPYRAICADIDEEDFLDKLEEEMKRQNIKGFHLVYCALSLHHTADTLSALKKLWKVILPGGYIYIRTCDDGLKIGYPDPNENIKSIIERTAQTEGVSDRFHGRKLYNLLRKVKFTEIESRPFVINTAGKDVVDRYALFSNTFLWRKNYFKKALDAAVKRGEDEQVTKALEEYNWSVEKTDAIEDMFMDFNFYYEYYVTIVIAKKKVYC